MSFKVISFSEPEHSDYRLLSQMYHLCIEGIYNCLYYKYLNSFTGDLSRNAYIKNWVIGSMNAYYDCSVKNWCMLFGSKNEPTHYSRLLNHQNIKDKLQIILGMPPITDERLKMHFFNELKITEKDYQDFFEKTKKYRDKHLIHREHSPKKINDGDIEYPKVDTIMNSYYIMTYLLICIFDQFPSHVTGKYELEYFKAATKADVIKTSDDHIAKFDLAFKLTDKLQSAL